MIALFAGEVRRVLARRLVKVLALLALAGIALAGVLVFLQSQKLSAAQLEARRASARARVDACMAGGGTFNVDGRRVSGPPVGSPQRQEFCRFQVGHVDDNRFALRKLKGILQGTTAPLVIVGWLVGASAIGADWQTRTVTTLLTWEPRRVRVLVAKVLACILVASAFAVLAQALLGVALVPAAHWRGTTAGTGGDWPRSVAGVLGRGVGLVAIATAVGFAVASIGRNTAAALGIGFAYILVVENVVGNFLADFRRWLLLGNAIVLVSGKDSGGEVSGRSVVAAAVYLSAVAVGLLVLAGAAFRRRDVA